MRNGREYGPLRGEEDLLGYRRIVERCFDMESERSARWVESAGAAGVRLVRAGGKVEAGLTLIEMGQYFGGERVPMAGVAAVGVLPEARGSGVATELMRAAVRELRELGRPLSALYPATQPLYRRAGYELAGSRLLVRAEPGALSVRERELELRPVEESDLERVTALYEEHARTRPGYLSRGPYVWSRVRTTAGGPAEGYLVERDGELAGYLYLVRVKRQPLGYDLALTDLVARDAPAARRLLAFLADHRSMVKEVRWHQAPGGPILPLIPERGARVELDFHWMLRIVHLGAALEARGYAPCIDAELHLEIEDELVAENAGRWVLRVAGGRAEVERGGRGELALEIRGLAALYSGFHSAETLAQSGRARGPDEVLRLASGIFAGPAPGMPDMF